MSKSFEEEKLLLQIAIADEEQKLQRRESFQTLMNRYYATPDARLSEIQAQNSLL
jgi:uncharacterized tellurite resistance protein B-like protein